MLSGRQQYCMNVCLRLLVTVLLAWVWNLPVARAQDIPVAQEPANKTGRGLPVESWPPLLELSFELVNNLPVVQATVDGRSGNFLFDTGAEMTLLNQQHFKGIPSATPAGAGATGKLENASSYRVARFDWHGVSFRDADLTAVDLDHLSPNGPPLLGLIGADLLMHYAVTLDYPKRKIILRVPTKQKPNTPPLKLPFVLQGHLPVVRANIAGETYNLTIDSGAGVNMLAEECFTSVKTQLANPFTTNLGGASSQAKAVKGGTIKQITLGKNVRLVDMVTIFTVIGPLANSKPTPIDGILGYEFLRQYQVTINYPERVLELR